MSKRWVILCLTSLFWSSLAFSSPIDEGYDLFETEKQGAEVDLGSMIVKLVGNPGPLASEKLGTTDTIVHRASGINPFEQGGSGTIEIELVTLSLKSSESFDASKLPPGPSGEKFPEGTMVDLYVVINKLGLPDLPETKDILKPSGGSMTINHDNADGEETQGTFASHFPAIQALLVFVKAGGKLGEDDVLSMPDPNPIELSSNGHWSHQKQKGNPSNEKYPAGEFHVVSIVHVGPHPVIPSPVTFTQPFTATMLPSGVELTWETGMEKDMAGFAVYRGELKEPSGVCTDNVDDYAALTRVGWKDSQGGLEGASYSIMDSSKNNQECYALVATEFDGTFELQLTKASR